MPSTSQNQQQAAGIALSAKRKGQCGSLPQGSASRQMCESMTIAQLEEFAGTTGTKRSNLPEKRRDYLK